MKLINYTRGAKVRKRVTALVVLTFLLMVAGCTSREYDANMDLGKEQVQEENYLEAYDAFALAYKDQETDEAKELMELSKYLADGISHYEEKDFEAALTAFEKGAGYEAKTKLGKKMVKIADEWVTKIDHMNEDSSDVVEEETLSPEEEAALEEQNIEVPADVKEPEKSDVNTEPKRTETDSNSSDSSNSSSADVSKEQNQNQNKEDSKKLTVQEAEQLVKDFIEIEDYPYLRVQYDHDDEKGDYIFQVFESVEDNEYGHTATWGWYGVNPKTKEVYDIMQ